jgi:serine/alanine adding enzyme
MAVELSDQPHLWDAYVDAAPSACNVHSWIWKEIIQETFGHEAYYLAASEAGVIRGALPLFFIESHLFGRSLVSVPFFSYGGVLASTSTALRELLGKAVELARELNARHIELRQGNASALEWQDSTAKVTMDVPLPRSPDDLWRNLSSGMRNKIRYALKQGLRAEWDGENAIDHFYTVFATNMRNLGTPVYPRKWFENIYRRLNGRAQILTVWNGHEPVATAFLTSFRQTLELPWSASLPDSRRVYSHVFLYWTFIEWAIQNGYARVDLGRSTPGSGTHEFKRHWRCEEHHLHWYYWLGRGVSIPHLRPDNPRFRLATRVWQKLPLGIANLLGPRIVRSIP